MRDISNDMVRSELSPLVEMKKLLDPEKLKFGDGVFFYKHPIPKSGWRQAPFH